MYSKKYWNLINKYLSNECTEKDFRTIENLRKKDREFDRLFEETMNLLAFKEEEPQKKSVDKKWQEIKNDILNLKNGNIYKIEENHEMQSPSRRLVSRIIRYAAVLLLVTGLPYMVYNKYYSIKENQIHKNFRVIKVAHSERQAITLSDGTKITLDAGSELKIPDNYNENRHVYLNGEAFFQVVHDADHPFRVFAENALIKVLGTEFDVRAWREVPNVTVTVKRGKVALGANDLKSDHKVFLTKGKQSSLSRNGVPSVPVTVNVNEYISWMNNELHFKNASLKEILAQLERWYDFNFVVDDSLLYSNRLTYHVKKSNINNLLESISIITNTKVNKEGKTIKLIQK